MYLNRGRLYGITQAQRDMYLSDLFSAQAQYAAAQQALQVCIGNSENMAFCNDGTIAGAPAYWAAEINRLQALLAQPVDSPAISVPASPSTTAAPGQVVAPNASGTPPSLAPATYGVTAGDGGMPVQTEVQTFSGEMLLPGAGSADAQGSEKSGAGWLALLAAGAALMLGS